MKDLVLSSFELDPNGYWEKPVDKLLFIPIPSDLDLFDQNGYDLTELEKQFANHNHSTTHLHRSHRTALKNPWFTQPQKIEGAVLNHSLLFERKAYSGEARTQLERWSTDLPLIHKLLALRPKWGLDFSMDYVDRDGNSFEVLHWEYDGFDYNEIQEKKIKYEPLLLDTDWDYAGKQILKHKDQWHHLDFFKQSEWKCQYFGIENERFKMVIWE